ncbi:DUF2062 domain-containing protein [Hymenobacter sp. ASUV-10]|uniref:DUF2062 domain-containing protein n=1 Tax=Hymenobacter aranciens TaxID=3063996 RepID=A0ABT9BGH1_9BACT|nr:DUF2062 domain-containing protein [Hymenobacter sp. ASUV-10]MDO7876758.1 DUF2062 domain-containing protein [Hymenobacter sp. ASUV-10]
MSDSSLPPPAPAGGWLRRRVVQPFLNLLKQGLAPEQLALTVALGAIIGLVPSWGVTTPLAAFTALRLRLNVAAMQLVGHLMSPLQLLILLPALRQGAILMGSVDARGLTFARIKYLFSHDWRGALSLLWRAQVGALALWALAAGPLAVGLYFGLRPVFRRLARRNVPSPQEAQAEHLTP